MVSNRENNSNFFSFHIKEQERETDHGLVAWRLVSVVHSVLNKRDMLIFKILAVITVISDSFLVKSMKHFIRIIQAASDMKSLQGEYFLTSD